jgi:hypothetical protein
LEEANLTGKLVLLPIAILCVVYPTNEISNSRAPTGTESEKAPVAFVVVLDVPPTTEMVASGNGLPVVSSVTLPVIVRL